MLIHDRAGRVRREPLRLPGVDRYMRAAMQCYRVTPRYETTPLGWLLLAAGVAGPPPHGLPQLRRSDHPGRVLTNEGRVRRQGQDHVRCRSFVEP